MRNVANFWCGIRNAADGNPESKFHWQIIRNPWRGIQNQDCLGFPYVGQHSSLRSRHRYFWGAKRENSRTSARGEEMRGHLLSPSRVPLARPLKKTTDACYSGYNTEAAECLIRYELPTIPILWVKLQDQISVIKRVLEVTKRKKATLYSRNGRKTRAYFHRFHITNNQLWIFCILRRFE